MVCTEPKPGLHHLFRVRPYDLAATLDSGQAFRWTQSSGSWIGVVGGRWVRLRSCAEGIAAETAAPVKDWGWLGDYLQVQVDLNRVLDTLPPHPQLASALTQHRGLRLLRQDPWECLASFILSSTKQIKQIKQIVERLCREHGDRVPTPATEPEAWSFPVAGRVADLRETDLRAMGMGFRAPHLLRAAQAVAFGSLDLEGLKRLSLAEARASLMNLPGVGRKIADCVLLFSLGFDEAFPVDVWVMRALKSAWFPNRSPSLKELVRFSESHFGPHAGYAQQYLFHQARSNSSFPRLKVIT